MTAHDDICQLGATELIDAYLTGETTPIEVVEALIVRAEQVDSELNALAAAAFERARVEARQATATFARLRRGPRGGRPSEAATIRGSRPLEGIPLVVKDLFDTAGIETSYGSPMFAGHVPDRDAEVVRRARAAGAIVLAKTATDEFAYGITSHNPHFGPVLNPWARERVAGGSSGGSAAALAGGVAPLALGSDTGGSIRVPASFCGVVGFKPTYGKVSNRGLFPMASSLDHSGPMARSPADVRLLFERIVVRRTPRRGTRRPISPRRLRLVVCPDLRPAGGTADVEAAFWSMVELARDLGVEIVERPLRDADRIFPTFLTIQRVETSLTHRSRGLYPDRREEYGADVRERLDLAATVKLEDYWRAEAQRDRLRGAFDELLDGGLLLAPIQARTPTEVGAADVEERTREIVMDQTVPQNLTGAPACTIRAGFDDGGLPVGVQVVGPPGADAAVLDAAELLWSASPALQGRWPRVGSAGAVPRQAQRAV